jgi:hypothetical protein
MQSVHIIINVVNSNPVHSEVYSIQHCVMTFELWQIGKPNKDPVVTFFNILGTRHSDFSLFKFLLHFDFCPAELISGFWVVMVFNTTFINILVISWWSVLLVEKIGVLGENHRSATIQMSLHNVVSSTPRYERDSNSQR